jgi:hypothetical protein
MVFDRARTHLRGSSSASSKACRHGSIEPPKAALRLPAAAGGQRGAVAAIGRR